MAITDVPVTYPHEMGLLKEARDQYSRDSFYKRVMDASKAFKNFEVADGFIHLNLHDRTVWCVPDIRVGERRLQESIIDQAHSLLAHLGSQKTLLPARVRLVANNGDRRDSILCFLFHVSAEQAFEPETLRLT